MALLVLSRLWLSELRYEYDIMSYAGNMILKKIRLKMSIFLPLTSCGLTFDLEVISPEPNYLISFPRVWNLLKVQGLRFEASL